MDLEDFLRVQVPSTAPKQEALKIKASFILSRKIKGFRQVSWLVFVSDFGTPDHINATQCNMKCNTPVDTGMGIDRERVKPREGA